RRPALVLRCGRLRRLRRPRAGGEGALVGEELRAQFFGLAVERVALLFEPGSVRFELGAGAGEPVALGFEGAEALGQRVALAPERGGGEGRLAALGLGRRHPLTEAAPGLRPVALRAGLAEPGDLGFEPRQLAAERVALLGQRVALRRAVEPVGARGRRVRGRRRGALLRTAAVTLAREAARLVGEGVGGAAEVVALPEEPLLLGHEGVALADEAGLLVGEAVPLDGQPRRLGAEVADG